MSPRGAVAADPVETAATMVKDLEAEERERHRRAEGAVYIRRAQSALRTTQAAVVRETQNLAGYQGLAAALEAVVKALAQAPFLDRVEAHWGVPTSRGFMNSTLRGVDIMGLLEEARVTAATAASGEGLRRAEEAVAKAEADLERVSRKFAT